MSRWLYHRTLPARIFEDEAIEPALSEGWVLTPAVFKNEKKEQEEKPSEPEKPKKYLSQMNTDELKEEGLKHGIQFTDETKNQMRKAINERLTNGNG